MTRLACGVASIALAVATSSMRAESSDVVLSVLLPDELFVEKDIRLFTLTVQLKNQGTEAVYVAPVIGQLEGHLKILARRKGSGDRPAILFDRASSGAGHDIDDLFRLMPHRSLQLPLQVWYPEAGVAGEDGIVEIWAEYDCRRMQRFGPAALATQLVSEPVAAPLVMLGPDTTISMAQPPRKQEW